MGYYNRNRGLLLKSNVANPILLGLVGYYKLDGNSNDSYGSINGIDTNITYSLLDGKINKGALFIGTAFIDFGTNYVFGLTTFSISFWIKNSPTGTRISILSHCLFDGTGYYYDVLASGIIRAGFASSGGVYAVRDSAVSINNGLYNHIVITRPTLSSPPDIYINGSLQNAGTFTAGTVNDITTASNFLIGQSPLVGSFPIVGRIDEFGLWSRVLTALEVTELYNSNVGIQYPF